MAGTAGIVVRGIVLRETETKEADKILTLLTDGCGKLRVIAKGARRKGCRFAAAAQPLAWSEWTLYPRGEWYYAREGTTLELFSGLAADLEALALAAYFAELTESVTAEGEPAGELLRHLLNGLYALAVLHKPPALVKPAFELRLLCLAGYEPLVDACAYCGTEDPEKPVLDAVQGVLRCSTCGGLSRTASSSLCPASLAALRHIVYGDPKRLYAFRLGDTPLRRLTAAAETFLMAQLDRRFQTLDFYHSLSRLPATGKDDNKTDK